MRRWAIAGGIVTILAVALLVWKFVRVETPPEKPGVTGSPYLAHVADDRSGGKSGVVTHDEARAYRGVTVFGCRDKPKEATLIGMDGEILHEWRLSVSDGERLLWLQPDRDGNLLAAGLDYLARIDWSGKVLWQAPEGLYHHGLDEGPDGKVYAMCNRKRVVTHGGVSIPIIDDLIQVYSTDGKLLSTISLFDLLRRSFVPRVFLDRLVKTTTGTVPPKDELENSLKMDHVMDVLHHNAVVVIDRDDLGYCSRGDLLICLRSLDLIAVIDPQGTRVVWHWELGQLQLDRPHAPVLTRSGNILVFDNGWARGSSRLVEVDPRKDEVVWEYAATPAESFYTRRGGAAQPLPNGNILVTEQDQGHLFEITRDGKLVWDYWNPKTGAGGKRRTIYRAWRLGPEDLSRIKIDDATRKKLRSKGYLNN